MATTKEQSEDEPRCPVCLGDFSIPQLLPEDTKHDKLAYIECPVCRQTASPFKRNEPTIFQSMFEAKSNVDRVCDGCKSEGVTVTAEGFCAVCQDAMCGDCLKVHKKQKVSKSHTIITMDELSRNPQNIMKLAEGVACSEHDSEYVQFYCRDHTAACCATCSFRKHKTCSNVIDFKMELPSLFEEIKPENIVDGLKKVETHLKRYMELNESCINGHELQVKGFSNQVQEIRRKINIALDELETQIKIEGSRICEEHELPRSYGNSEEVRKRSDPQKFLMTEKMALQMSSYYSRTTSENLTIPGLLKTTKDCQFEKVDAVDVKLPDSTTSRYFGVTFLPGNRVMLANTLTGKPAGLCVVDDQEVAVSLLYYNTIQILSVRNNIISPCNGKAAAGMGEMFVTGDFDNNKYYWSLISMEGDVKSSQQFDAPSGSYNNMAINRAKTRVYVTLPDMNTLLCFDMEGKNQFSYNPSNLKHPYGVLVDRDDNIFVTGYGSSNIHHLSPDGSVIQVITTGVPKRPFAICMDKSRDMFIVTDMEDKRKIHMYRLK
ncbi:hypothetical protein CHS0354_004925 [Potamilus streckersoni]|uniref:B box-type domain-containing protein n=1 Tax=Potamilus streckersoni TaxID=2493646 RepID=A0AAE0TJ83_9BIVA|nr:hypothetical protein CHS0354_004925 [Potamilus streckersoni]